MTFLWLFWYQIIPFSNLIFFYDVSIPLCVSATNKNGVSFIHLHSQNLSLHAQMHHGGINLNDFSSTCICLQLLHMSSVSWVLRNRYTLVSKSVSAVDRKGNKIIILLYGIVQIIYWESWSKRVYLVCRYSLCIDDVDCC